LFEPTDECPHVEIRRIAAAIPEILLRRADTARARRHGVFPACREHDIARHSMGAAHPDSRHDRPELERAPTHRLQIRQFAWPRAPFRRSIAEEPDHFHSAPPLWTGRLHY